MDNAGYVTITRQSGLKQEMRVIANNIANMSTSGFRRETTVFAEMIEKLPVAGGSLSMTAAHVRDTRFDQAGWPPPAGPSTWPSRGPVSSRSNPPRACA